MYFKNISGVKRFCWRLFVRYYSTVRSCLIAPSIQGVLEVRTQILHFTKETTAGGGKKDKSIPHPDLCVGGHCFHGAQQPCMWFLMLEAWFCLPWAVLGLRADRFLLSLHLYPSLCLWFLCILAPSWPVYSKAWHTRGSTACITRSGAWFRLWNLKGRLAGKRLGVLCAKERYWELFKINLWNTALPAISVSISWGHCGSPQIIHIAVRFPPPRPFALEV